MKLLIAFTIFLSSLTIIGQEFDTEFKYDDSLNKGITIQNSYPKGGVAINGISGYTDSSGKTHGFGIFWTRVINETATPLELTVNFPADSFAISQAPNSYFKLFLPPDTMTVDKVSLYNYGYDITDIESFLDTNFDKPTMLQRTINPKEECLFYVIMLIHFPEQSGSIRAGLFLKEQDLFYRFTVNPLGSEIIPSGQIVFKKLKQ